MAVHSGTISLTYVSKSRLASEDAEEVDAIVEASRKNNARVGITGALLFTGRDFAQTLEGDRQAVLDLMERIKRDPRHDQVEIVHQSDNPVRSFANWSMAYRGLTTYVQRHVDAARDRSAHSFGSDVGQLELRQLLLGFARGD